jgi:hypothetical protein
LVFAGLAADTAPVDIAAVEVLVELEELLPCHTSPKLLPGNTSRWARMFRVAVRGIN